MERDRRGIGGSAGFSGIPAARGGVPAVPRRDGLLGLPL